MHSSWPAVTSAPWAAASFPKARPYFARKKSPSENRPISFIGLAMKIPDKSRANARPMASDAPAQKPAELERSMLPTVAFESTAATMSAGATR